MTGPRIIVLTLVCVLALVPGYANSVLFGVDEGASMLRWKTGSIRIAVSTSLLRENPNVKRDSDVAGAIRRSIETWSQVADIDVVQVSSDKLSASPAGAVGDGISLITIAPTAENVLLFSKDPENAAATTRIFFNRRGLITEADIVLNPYQQFSTDGTLGTFDLESTLTHEIGHLLGLPHSFVLGATMHENYGKNGVFGLQNIGSRTLSADDIASIRAVYGVRDDDTCCGSIDGRVSGIRQFKNATIWIEDLSGRVHGSTKLGADGDFRFSGLTAGKYRVFGQEVGRAKLAAPASHLGDATVVSGEATAMSVKVALGNRDFDLTYLGLNGQLSEMAVSFSAGRTYLLYLGGRNLDPRKLTLNFTSPHISAVPGTFRSHDYGDDVSVISVEVRVSPKAPRGEYSLYLESERGDQRAIIGGLTVDNLSQFDAQSTSVDD